MLNKEMNLICSEAASLCLVLSLHPSHSHLSSAAGDGERRHGPILHFTCAGHVVHLAHSHVSFGAGDCERRGGPKPCHQASQAGNQGPQR